MARGATYYVATTGRDADTGTSLTTPFRTIQRAAMKMVEGDTCFIRGGIYREMLKPAASGAADAPITFTAYQGEDVVISGADVVTNWTPYSGHIYQAPMDWDLGMGNNQIFVDGKLMFQARFPHMRTADRLFKPALSEVTVTADTVTSKDLNQPDNYWTDGYVVGRANVGWAWQWARITASSSLGILRIKPGSTRQMIPVFGDISWFTGTGQVYLIGKLAALDAPGEWHYENGTLCLWTPAGDNPGAHRVEAKHRAWAVDFNGKDFIVVRGLRLFAGAVNMSGNNCRLENCLAAYLSHFTLFSWSGYDGNGGAADGYQGIVVSGSDNAIVGCTIAYTAGSAIVLGGKRDLVLRCSIHDVDYSGTYGEPIKLMGSQNRVWFNTIYDSGRDIIYPGGTDHDIRFNDLSHSGLLCKDVGVIYSGETDGQGTRIAYNWIHDNPLAINGIGPGIYLDNYSRNFRVDHNVVWNCAGDAGIRINAPALGDRVYNNTLCNCDDVGTHTYNCWPDNNPDPAFWTKNLYQFDSANNLCLGANPSSQLVDYGSRDFRLIATAPAVDAGVAIPGFTDGYKGSAPDKGAYEFGGVHWTAGINGIAPDGPVVTNGSGASNVRDSSARLNGQVDSTYFQPTHIIIFWGLSDGGTDSAAWANSKALELTADGPFGVNLTGLAPDTTYCFRCYASNASNQAWAGASSSFRTLQTSGRRQP